MEIESRLQPLFEMGYQIERKEQAVENRMEEIMLKKRVTLSTLGKMTGISKQTIHAVIKGRMKPGIDFALKVSTILQVPVEELFKLNESAWQTLVVHDNKSVYWDLAEMEIVERPDAKKLEEEQGVEYWDLKNSKLISEAEYQRILENELEKRMDEEKENARQKIRRRDEKVHLRFARETIEKDVENRYPQRFQRVVKSIKPESIS